MKGVVRLSRPKKGAATRLYPVYGRILCSLSARGANCTAGVCANGRLRPVPLCWLGRGLAGRGEAALLATIVLATGVDAYGRRPNDPFAERNVARFILLLLLLDALVQAGFDVTLAQGGRIRSLLVRWLHLAAFGLWFGGAVWNIFITVPAARGIVSLPVVVAASQQLERFRLAVRLILPTIIVTGFIQAYRYVGSNLNVLTASTFGWLILVKILLIGVLIIVFLTCLMWRACSPISGMCKLDDLYAKEHE